MEIVGEGGQATIGGAGEEGGHGGVEVGAVHLAQAGKQAPGAAERLGQPGLRQAQGLARGIDIGEVLTHACHLIALPPGGHEAKVCAGIAPEFRAEFKVEAVGPCGLPVSEVELSFGHIVYAASVAEGIFGLRRGCPGQAAHTYI